MADTKISGLSAVTDVLTSDEFVLARSGTTKKITGADLASEIGGTGGGATGSYVLLQDRRTANTAGGGSTSGSWQTRTLQTEVSDADGLCSLSANQFTLDAGIYRCRGWAQIVNAGQCKNRIRNVTAGTTLVVGASDYTGADGGVMSAFEGEFTVAASQALELQSRVTSSKATDGYGVQANFGEIEIYASIELWLLA